MNKRLYRVIYNYSIGLWQVASELTLRKGARSSGDGEPCQRLAALRGIPFALVGSAGLGRPSCAGAGADRARSGRTGQSAAERAGGGQWRAGGQYSNAECGRRVAQSLPAIRCGSPGRDPQ